MQPVMSFHNETDIYSQGEDNISEPNKMMEMREVFKGNDDAMRLPFSPKGQTK